MLKSNIVAGAFVMAIVSNVFAQPIVTQSTIDSTNRNINESTSTSTSTSTTNSNSYSKQDSSSNSTTTVKSPPPTAIAPSITSINNDLCTVGASGAVQTQLFGMSLGGTQRDMNCERLKLSKTLYDMGMKVAAVATMCQDRRVFDAMWNAGTPCPYEGVIGEQARVAWNANQDKWPKPEEPKSDDFYKKTGFGAFLGAVLFSIFR